MALPKSYLTSTKNLKAIFEAIQAAQAPDKFSARFLETLGFASSNDRLLIGVLKDLGFLDGDGKPKERYFRYLDQTQSRTVLAEAVRESYADLFSIRTDAEKLSKADLINKAKTLSQGSLSDSVLDKFALTFTALVGLSDFSEPARPNLKPHATIAKTESAQIHETQNEGQLGKSNIRSATAPDSGADERRTLGGLHYNIQIILPATRDPAIYDAIFRSIKEHLLA